MMKKITLLLFSLFSTYCFSQIANGDFETAAGADWTAVYYDAVGNGGTVDPSGSFETTGGNPDGYHSFTQGDLLGNNQQASSLKNSVISAPIALVLNDLLEIKVTIDAKSDIPFNGDNTDMRITALIPHYKIGGTKSSNKNSKFEEYTSTNNWQTLTATASLLVDNITHDPGNYDVQIRLDFGKFPLGKQLDLDNVSVEFSVNGEVLSTEDITKEDASISLYPNPATNRFTVNSTNHIDKIEVYNLLGQKVLSQTSPEVNVSNLTKGVYISKIYQENDIVSTKRFVKN